MSTSTLSAVKVFSATLARDRDNLGERVGIWLAANPELRVLDVATRQTSDNEFHCLTITLFLAGDASRIASPPVRIQPSSKSHR